MTRLAAHQLPPVGRLRDALRAGGLDDLPDADLLDRFARYGEHPAFDALLRRHGPMVFGVCRRVLANLADAEDAFQATFLVFVRKARSLRRGDRLGPWLYRVAVRVAMKARSRAARLAGRRTEATDMIPDPTTPAEVPDWLPVLDAELSALPAKYREPLVLCELQGASRADAAKALGIPEGTLSSRLARGRELLRKRLLKHGTLLPAGGLASLFAAGGMGRAAVPAGLLAKTSEVAAVIATGAAPAGAVPAGPARLTDEVLKGMFITKLRVAGGAVLAAGLVAVGLMAAWPGEAPGQPDRPKEVPKTAKAAGAKVQPTKPAGPQEPRPAGFVDNGTVLPDRDAIQGLWVLDKCDLGKGVGGDDQRETKEMIGKMQFLVAGDVWWGLVPRERDGINPMVARIDPAKNPKWLDLTGLSAGGGWFDRCIYELDGDRLRVCIANAGKDARPAEFNTDDDTPLVVMHFRREKSPPAAGEKALVGSWQGETKSYMTTAETPNGGVVGSVLHIPAPRVEILDGYLFAFIEEGGNGKWLGGKYTVDTTKNPKWIDVELVSPRGDKVTKLYGCYEIAEGRLRLALGTTGKRVVRPLEFKHATDVLFFDLKLTNVALGPKPVAVDYAVPVGNPKPKAADTPVPAPRPKPTDKSALPAPVPKGP
jgi:RNA polymerase sigma factor (sigma-70 family)